MTTRGPLWLLPKETAMMTGSWSGSQAAMGLEGPVPIKRNWFSAKLLATREASSFFSAEYTTSMLLRPSSESKTSSSRAINLSFQFELGALHFEQLFGTSFKSPKKRLARKRRLTLWSICWRKYPKAQAAAAFPLSIQLHPTLHIVHFKQAGL